MVNFRTKTRKVIDFIDRIPSMGLNTLVKHGIQGMEQNKKRVVPGFSKLLRFAGKYFPDALSNVMARG